MIDMRPRWTIQKNPVRFPANKAEPWVVFETAAALHATPLLARFKTFQDAKIWARNTAPEDTEVIVVKSLKRSYRACGQPL